MNAAQLCRSSLCPTVVSGARTATPPSKKVCVFVQSAVMQCRSGRNQSPSRRLRTQKCPSLRQNLFRKQNLKHAPPRSPQRSPNLLRNSLWLIRSQPLIFLHLPLRRYSRRLLLHSLAPRRSPAVSALPAAPAWKSGCVFVQSAVTRWTASPQWSLRPSRYLRQKLNTVPARTVVLGTTQRFFSACSAVTDCKGRT